jgi:hypothetical protein
MHSPAPTPSFPGSTPQAAFPPDFSDLPRVPLEHFKLCWFGAVLHVLRSAHDAFGVDATRKAFPFLAEYEAQLQRRSIDAGAKDACERFWTTVETWEATASTHLPLRAVRVVAELGWRVVGALVAAGLHEEDPRFGAVFAALQGGNNVPTVGFLNACFSDGERGPVRSLQDSGLLAVSPEPGGRHAWSVQVPAWVWDAVSHATGKLAGPGFTFEPALPRDADDDLLSERTRATLHALPDLVRSSAIGCVVLRGPHASGRQRAARRLASELGRGVLLFAPPLTPADARWGMLPALSSMLGAVPVVELELGPGETVSIPELGDFPGPLVLVLGRCGGVEGRRIARSVTLVLEVPNQEQRRALWSRFLPQNGAEFHAALADRYRMPTGRLAALAEQGRANAALAGRSAPELADFAARARAMHTAALGSLATA